MHRIDGACHASLAFLHSLWNKNIIVEWRNNKLLEISHPWGVALGIMCKLEFPTATCLLRVLMADQAAMGLSAFRLSVDRRCRLLILLEMLLRFDYSETLIKPSHVFDKEGIFTQLRHSQITKIQNLSVFIYGIGIYA